MVECCPCFNHFALECWYKYFFFHFYQHANTQQALATFSLNDTHDDAFYMDSGATSDLINIPGILN